MRSAPFQLTFRIGQRVRLTDAARRHGVRLEPCTKDRGTVLGQPSATTVRVRPDNYKTTSKYHDDFWEADE
jgi:hypothetical protein